MHAACLFCSYAPPPMSCAWESPMAHGGAVGPAFFRSRVLHKMGLSIKVGTTKKNLAAHGCLKFFHPSMIHLSICPSIYLSIFQSINDVPGLSLSLSASQSRKFSWRSDCLSLYLSSCLFTSIPLFLYEVILYLLVHSFIHLLVQPTLKKLQQAVLVSQLCEFDSRVVLLIWQSKGGK